MFKLEIQTDNAAFRDEVTGELDEYMEAYETARILGSVRSRLQNGERSGSIMDINGNKVGSWSLK